MKKTLLFSLALLLFQSITAQDVCSELMKFNNNKKYANRTCRMNSKTKSMGQTLVMERDKSGNFHQTITMDMVGQGMKIETLFFDSKMYSKRNDEEWELQVLDSSQLEIIKNEWQNNQLQCFKNCKKLDNETTDGKNYRVYTADFDAEQMKALMNKSSQSMPNEDMFKDMDMKMTFFINDKDDVEKAILKTVINGQSFDSDVVFEYDIEVTVKPPSLLAEKKD